MSPNASTHLLACLHTGLEIASAANQVSGGLACTCAVLYGGAVSGKWAEPATFEGVDGAVRCRAAGCDTKRCGAEQQDAIRSGVAQYDTAGSGGSYDARRVAHVCTGVNVYVHDCACTWCGGSSLLRLAVSRSASMSTETPPTMALGRAGPQGSRRHGITASLGGAGQQADDKVGERREVAGGEGIGTSAKLLQRVDENGW